MSMLYRGDGSRRTGRAMVAMLQRIAGYPPPPASSATAEGVRADRVPIAAARGIAVGPDGSIYYSERYMHRIRKISPDGFVNTIAGVNAQAGFNGDNQPATQALLNQPRRLTIGPDGTIYFIDESNYRVRKISPDGIITTVAGNGLLGTRPPDGALATSGSSGSVYGLDVSSDGNLYLAFNNSILKVAPDGIITTVAGSWNTNASVSSGDGGPAVDARFRSIYDMALGPDGSIYISESSGQPWDGYRIRRIDRSGIINKIAGTVETTTSEDGVPAISASIGVPDSLAVGQDGSVYFAALSGELLQDNLIRRISPDGVLTTFAGNRAPRPWNCNACGLGGPPTAAWFLQVTDLAVTPDDRLMFIDGSGSSSYIGRVDMALPRIQAAHFAIASDDGTEVYIFDQQGKHLVTHDTLLGTVRYEFGYDAKGRLSTITDVDQQVTTIQRNADGYPTAILAPTGQSTALTLDAEHYLWKVTNPANETTTLSYYPNSGLLQSLEDPLGRLHQFEFDAKGRLIRDEDPADGYKQLTRTETPNGHRVTVTTAMGLTRGYEVATLPDGSKQRIRTGSDGLSTVEQISTSGARTTTAADGTVTSIEVNGDPRFGMQSPLVSSEVTTTPLGRTRQVTRSRSVVLTAPTNALTLSSFTEIMSINGRASSLVFNKATRATVHTSPAGRQSTITLTPEGRTQRIAVPAILPVISRTIRMVA
ncbi:hypothetical protein [Sorangium sp. So ce204]|uniref:NHL domain-containing protein n=1 Tax=Sorangium sp. So ce204 TaxID=3133288 RepID=UPI003F61EA51